MPIYEYKCGDCGENFEALVMGSEDAVECEKCGSKKLERQMSCFSSSSGSMGDLLASAGGGNPGCGGSGFS
jgi:putative FmdB family regulatory protein